MTNIEKFISLYDEYRSYLSGLNRLIHFTQNEKQNKIELNINGLEIQISSEFTKDFINYFLSIINSKKKQLIEIYKKIDIEDEISQQTNELIKSLIND